MKHTEYFDKISVKSSHVCFRWLWILGLVCGTIVHLPDNAFAQTIERRNEDSGQTGNAKLPLFRGLELNPEILSKIEHKTRVADWSQYEIDAYYEILGHIQKTPSNELRKKAAENRLANIELYREVAQRIHDRDVKKNERNVASKLEARLDKYKDFQKHPETFPSFVMLFRSIDEDNPYEYHGKLVTLSGRIQRLISYPARQNRQGIERLYEAWIYTEDSQHNPTVVVMTTKPEGMPEGENIYESGTVTGIFFKMHVYEDAGKKMRMAPMILAHGLQWKPTSEKKTSGWAYVMILVPIGFLLAVTVWLSFQDRRMRKARHELKEQETNLSEITQTENPRSHLEDLESQDRLSH